VNFHFFFPLHPQPCMFEFTPPLWLCRCLTIALYLFLLGEHYPLSKRGSFFPPPFNLLLWTFGIHFFSLFLCQVRLLRPSTLWLSGACPTLFIHFGRRFKVLRPPFFLSPLFFLTLASRWRASPLGHPQSLHGFFLFLNPRLGFHPPAFIVAIGLNLLLLLLFLGVTSYRYDIIGSFSFLFFHSFSPLRMSSRADGRQPFFFFFRIFHFVGAPRLMLTLPQCCIMSRPEIL